MARMRDDDGNVVDVLLEGEVPGEQTVRLLGPFRIAHDDAGVIDTGAVVATVPTGAVIFRAFAIAREDWNQTGLLVIGIGTAVDYQIIGYGSNAALGREYGLYESDIQNAHQILVSGEVVVPGNTSLSVAFYPDVDPPTTGEADIYALIAEPA